jgi:hypothetical protein
MYFLGSSDFVYSKSTNELYFKQAIEFAHVSDFFTLLIITVSIFIMKVSGTIENVDLIYIGTVTALQTLHN